MINPKNEASHNSCFGEQFKKLSCKTQSRSKGSICLKSLQIGPCFHDPWIPIKSIPNQFNEVKL